MEIDLNILKKYIPNDGKVSLYKENNAIIAEYSLKEPINKDMFDEHFYTLKEHINENLNLIVIDKPLMRWRYSINNVKVTILNASNDELKNFCTFNNC